jgi:hypothetical protein
MKKKEKKGEKKGKKSYRANAVIWSIDVLNVIAKKLLKIINQGCKSPLALS